MKRRRLAFTLTLDMRFPAESPFAPVHLPVNLSRLQRDAGQPIGLADLASLTLTDGADQAVPWQFTPETLPLLSPTVSMGLAAGLRPRIPTDTPLPADIAGTLTFHQRRDGGPYRLSFDIVTGGEAVQDYTPPRRLAILRDDGRFDPMPFAHMTVQPISPRDGMVSVYEDGQLRAAYHTQNTRRPYLYPLMGPGGTNVLSLGKPGESVGGHTHHMGLWVANRDLGGVNFWEDYGEGTIVHTAFPRLESGPLFATIEAENEWRYGERVLARETRRMVFYRAQAGASAVDITVTLSPVEGPLAIAQNTFGFLAIRTAETMSPYAGGYYLNAQGDVNEDQAFWQHAEWIAQTGQDGPDTRCCCMLMDHPDNAAFPTAWHMRNDGFIAAATARAGDLLLSAEKPLMLRHRVLLMPAHTEPDRDALHPLWQQFAAAQDYAASALWHAGQANG